MCFVCSGEVISLLVLLAIFPGRRWAECAARSTFRQVSRFEGGRSSSGDLLDGKS